jgi:aspartyl-tRNA(Asn)/glutamyl-tRNA(Gln) amidotransferase subunit A
MASVGTDSAGSVRNPASLCGTVGLKPTYGRISCHGGVPGTGGYTTNHFGILSKTANDCALLLRSIAGHDPKDPLSSEEPVPNYARNIGKKVKSMRVGVLTGYFDNDLASEVKRALDEAVRALAAMGMKTEEVVIPHLDLIPALQTASSRPEGNSDHEHFLRTRPRDYSPGLLHTLIAGLLIPASVYITAQRVRRLVCQEFDAVFEKVDVIVAPTTPIPAPTIEECNRGYVEWDGKKIQLQDQRGNFLTQCTIPFNVTGLPALSLCCGFSSLGLPIGMQIVSRPFQEEVVFQVAHAYEKATDWHERKPPL